MTAEILASIAGVALSLALSYIPGLSTFYNKLLPDYKRAIMGALLILATGAIFGLSCLDVMDTATCDQAGAVGLVRILIAALVANQAAFLISPRLKGPDIRLYPLVPNDEW